MHKSELRLLIGLGIAFLLPVVHAQDGIAQNMQRLQVQEAIALAHLQHPELNQIREQIRAKEGQRMTSFGLHAPTLSYMREGIDDGTFEEQRFSLSQEIDFPLTSYYRVTQRRTEQDALVLHLESATKRVTALVKKAYTEVLYAQELVHLREQEVELAEALTEAAGVRVEVGEASELDLMKAEIQLAEAHSDAEEASRLVENARYALFNVVGMNLSDQRFDMLFPDTLIYVPARITEEMVLGKLEQQPELKSASRRLEAAHVGVKQARSTLLPSIKVDYYPQDYGNGYVRRGFQVGLRLPLWTRTYRGTVQIARAAVQSQSWQKQAVLLKLKKPAEQAWHNYLTSKKTIDRYNNEVRARAAELLAKTQEGYRAGELDLLTLLDTQRTYLASELRYYNALRAYYFQLIELEQFVGEDLVFNP